MSQGAKTTIRLMGALGKKFGDRFEMYVDSPAEAVRALCQQLAGFEDHLRESGEQVKYAVVVGKRPIDPKTDLHELSGNKTIKIAPVLAGAKRGGLFQIILGAALIALSFTPMGAGTLPAFMGAGTWGGMMMAFGVSLMLGGVAQLLSPQPKMEINEGPNNRPSKSFSGPVNTSAQGQPVPIVYGEVMAGSAVISAGIYSNDT